MRAAPDAGHEVAPALPLANFEYELPPDRIAQSPLEPRDGSRLLHLRPGGELEDRSFRDLPALLAEGDLLVANDTTVRASRLRGRREDGGPAEILLLRRLAGGRFTALVRPGRRLRGGTRVEVGDLLAVTILGPAAGHPGARVVELDARGDLEETIAAAGEAPLPPYVTLPLLHPGRYQTVYARGDPASAAAPTAGLHFTEWVRTALAARGVRWATLQLEVGLGTFAPITSVDVASHRMHEERITLPEATAVAVDDARARGGRVIAVGTTVVRTLESRVDGGGGLVPGSGSTELFIMPGHRFGVVDGLLTNFHQPRSSLLVLLAAFAGDQQWRRAYVHARETGYRFLSFGDCMLCWRRDQRGTPR